METVVILYLKFERDGDLNKNRLQQKFGDAKHDMTRYYISTQGTAVKVQETHIEDGGYALFKSTPTTAAVFARESSR